MNSQDTSEIDPLGFKLRRILRGHDGTITRVVWSPDGRTLASGSQDTTIRLWDVATGKLRQILKGSFGHVYGLTWSPDGQLLASSTADDSIRIWNTKTGDLRMTLRGHTFGDIKQAMSGSFDFGHSDWVRSLAWSPDGQILASGSRDTTIQLWDTASGRLYHTFSSHSDEVYGLAWSPDGQKLASGSGDATVRLWNVAAKKLQQTLTGHHSAVRSVAWSPDGRFLASGSTDDTVRYWDFETRNVGALEGHTNQVTSVSFSSNSRFLASKATDGTIRFWRTDTWREATILPDPTSGGYWELGLAFHFRAPLIATLGERGRVIRIWEVDYTTLLKAAPVTSSVYYTNAKVVLVGDTGVGKSGLGLVLTGQDFTPTESTHGRQVWTFDSQEGELDEGPRLVRETLLWDLAGQPGYRLVHQLHLNEVATALVVFDARSETDPFAGVRHWSRALRQAQMIQGGSNPHLKRFLVAARMDRGGVAVSLARIRAFVRSQHFDGYFETSAKEGWQITELREAIRKAIDWDALPKISSTFLFQRIKTFLILEKKAGRLLSTHDDLYRAFLKTEALRREMHAEPSIETKGLKQQFETCIKLVESRGLIQRLSFGGLILLQPELLDAYASAMINAAKDEPDGLGSLAEEDALAGRFRMPEDERIKDKDQEKLLLLATIEDLLRHEIALRESTDAGPLLVFPSQFTREYPESSEPEGRALIFSFEGPVLNIYTRLTVRLSRGGLFETDQMWKNAATFKSPVGGTYGIFLRELEEGKGEFTIFYGLGANKEMCFQFETYVQIHLQRWALPNTVQRQRVIKCESCGFVVTDQLIRLRLERRFNWLNCPVCEAHILLEKYPEVNLGTIPDVDRTANIGREQDLAASILQGKMATNDFDVFLAHNSEDKNAVEEIGKRLRQRGINFWLDKEQIPPGRWFQDVIQQVIPKVKSAAIFIGSHGLGRWEVVELRTFVSQCVEQNLPVIPVLLPGVTVEDLPKNLLFLRELTHVRFFKSIDEAEALNNLEWGITGLRSY